MTRYIYYTCIVDVIERNKSYKKQKNKYRKL